MASYMVAGVMAIIQQLGKNSSNDQLTLLSWLLSINSHSNYSGQLIRSPGIIILPLVTDKHQGIEGFYQHYSHIP